MTLLALVLNWLVFGLVVGAVARVIYPGAQRMSFFATAMLGVVGSFVGGLLGNLLAGLPAVTLHGAGFLGSLVGALVVLAITGLGGRGASRRA